MYLKKGMLVSNLFIWMKKDKENFNKHYFACEIKRAVLNALWAAVCQWLH